MKLLFFLLLMSLAVNFQHTNHQYLLIFTNEGTYYMLDVHSKHVQWYSSLGTNLVSFQIGTTENMMPPSSYILPTLDGHFLYIDAQSEILIDRKEVEQLLNICFQGYSNRKDDQTMQYFIYEKYEYYIINLNNGHAQDIEIFLKNGIPNNLDRMAVLKVCKKFLKQLRSDFSIAWSTLSSQIDLVPASLFLKNPKSSSKDNKVELQHTKLGFRRIGNNEIELVTNQETFEIGGSSHILGIFSNIDPIKGYIKHPIKYYHRQKLSLQDKSSSKNNHFKLMLKTKIKQNKNYFIYSDEIKEKNKQRQPQQLQICVNTFRSLQALTDQSKNINKNIHFHYHQIDDNQSILYRQPEISHPKELIIYGPTDQQPFVLIALISTIVIGGYWLYKIKINSLLNQLSHMESKTGKKLEEFQQRLGQFEQLKKMYEIYWDRIVYKVAGDQWYEHVVFQGKFLNQDTLVYAVRQQGTDVVSLEHKLNMLLNFSHKGLAKLYYYTKNSQFLLIFTQKIQPLALKALPQYLSQNTPYNAKKDIIAQILEAISYLDGQIEISSLPNQAIQLQTLQRDQQTRYYFKLNSIPCLLRKNAQDSDRQQSQSHSSDDNTYEIRFNMVALFHLIIQKGQKFNKQKIDQLLKNQAYSQDQYLQFFDFILYQSKIKPQFIDRQIEIGENTRELMFKDILDHPFLWNSKRKILFLSDFSNYVETHIDQTKAKKLQNHAKDYNIIKTPWIKQFHYLFVREINNYRKYDVESVRDLIRVIRNKLNHFHQIPKQVRSHIGNTPQGFIEYCLSLFPKLLHFAFVYTRKKKWKLHMT